MLSSGTWASIALVGYSRSSSAVQRLEQGVIRQNLLLPSKCTRFPHRILHLQADKSLCDARRAAFASFHGTFDREQKR